MKNLMRLTGTAAALSLAACSQGFKSKTGLMSASSHATIIMGPITVAITAPDSQFNTQGRLTLAGRCTDGLDVSVQGDLTPVDPQTPVSTPCQAGVFSAQIDLNAPDGPKNIQVSQQDAQGKTAADSRSFMRDTSAPVQQLITPAAGALVAGQVMLQGLCESGLDLGITEAGKMYTVPCADGHFGTTLTLLSADGSVHIELAQTDAAGNKGLLPLDLRKDTVAPTVSITSPAAGASVMDSAVVSGGCEDGLSVVLAGTGAMSPVTTICAGSAFNAQVVFTSGAGNKQITVSQTDGAGNTGTASRAFNRLAAAGPAVAFTVPAAGTVFRDTLAVSGTCQSGLTVKFSGSGFQSPATTTCAGGVFSSTVSFTAGDGAKTLIAAQTNADNQTGSASRSFTRDTLAPVVTVVNPAEGSLAGKTVSVTGACENGLAVNLAGTGVSAGAAVTCANGLYMKSVTLTNGDGNKEITAAQTDAAGNIGRVVRHVALDTTAPAVKITAPDAGTSAATTLTVSGGCEGAFPVTANGSGVSAPVTQNCAAGVFSLTVTFTNGDGDKQIQVSQSDAAGNTGTDSRLFKRVTPAPVLDGVALYTQNCAACHGPLASSVKLGRTAAQITAAIASIPSMSSLSLSQPQIAAIASALTPVSTPPDGGGGGGPTPSGVSSYDLTLGNRTYLNSLYNDLFVATTGATADDTKIAGLTSSLLGSQVVANGGPCLVYDSDCNRAQIDTAPLAAASPTGNTMRKGYETRACEQILEIDKAVTNVLGKAGLSVSSSATAANVQTLFQTFNPGKTAPDAVISALIDVSANARANGYATVDQWRFLVLPLCLSSTMDIL